MSGDFELTQTYTKATTAVDGELHLRSTYDSDNGVLTLNIIEAHVTKLLKQQPLDTHPNQSDIADRSNDTTNGLRQADSNRFADWDLVHDFTVELILRDKDNEELAVTRTSVALPNGTQLTVHRNEKLWEFSPTWGENISLNLLECLPQLTLDRDLKDYEGTETIVLILFVGPQFFGEMSLPLKDVHRPKPRWYQLYRVDLNFLRKRTLALRSYIPLQKEKSSRSLLQFKRRKLLSLRSMFIIILSLQISVIILCTTGLLYYAGYEQLYQSAERVALQIHINVAEILDILLTTSQTAVVTTASSFLSPLLAGPNGPNMIAHTLFNNFEMFRQQKLVFLGDFGALNSTPVEQELSNFDSPSYQTAAELYVAQPDNTFYGAYPSRTIGNIANDTDIVLENIFPEVNDTIIISEKYPDCAVLNMSCNITDYSTSFLGSQLNSTNRTWYQSALNHSGPFWVNVYKYVGETLGITCSYRVPSDLAVPVEYILAIDITLDSLNTILASHKYYETGYVYVRERNTGYLVASSLNADLIDDNGNRIKAIDSPDERISKSEYVLQTECSLLFKSVGTCSGNNAIISAGPFYLTSDEWVVVAVIPESDFTRFFNEVFSISVIISIIFFFVSISISFVASQTLTYQFIRCTKQLRCFASFNFSHPLEESGLNSPVKEIARVHQGLNLMRVSLLSFIKYVPAEVVRMIMKSDQVADLGGSKRNITFFFTDIVDFTTIAEGLSLESLIDVLGEYFGDMTHLIQQNEGTVDKYIGDAIMAMWNGAESVSNHPSKACETALLYQRHLKVLRQEWKARNLPEMKVRIGIHTGNAIVGNFGSHSRLNYTALGDNVNLASRIEGLNKKYGTEIMISDETYKYVKEEMLCRPLDTVIVKGKTKPCEVYELVAFTREATSEQIKKVEDFIKAYQFYQESDFKSAKLEFIIYLRKYPDDLTAQLHLNTCINYESHPGDWKGYSKLTTK